MALDPSLFNCHHEVPDWTRFDWLEISPIHSVWGYCEPEDANYWCVHGHEISYIDEDGHEQGGLEDLVDCPTYEEAERIADLLSKHTGLPVR